MDIVVLPPMEEPKQYTVRTVSQTLGDHYVMFLNANNLTCYIDEKERVLSYNNIGDILLLIAARRVLTIKRLKDHARSIKKLSSKLLSASDALNVIARALGYRDWPLLMFCRHQDDTVENVWSGFEDAHSNLFSEESSIEQFALKNKHIHRLLTLNAKLNKTRSNSIKQKQRREEKESRTKRQSTSA